jgi:hypothetical protein
MAKPLVSFPACQTTAPEALQVFLVPCSCGRNIVVAGSDPPRGAWGRQLQCAQCGKKHDRHFRAVRFQYSGACWTSEGC